MSWYVHPSKQLRDDELPPELVVTNRDGSVEQVYVPYNASDQLEAENAKLRELVNGMWYCAHEAYGMCARVPVGGERPFTCCPLYDFDAKEYRCEKLMQELGIEVGE